MDKSIFVLGGATWINLLNTVVMRNKQPTDLLADPAITISWLEENQLLFLGMDSPLDQVNHDRIRIELVALREIFTKVLNDLERQGTLSAPVNEEIKKCVEALEVQLTTGNEGTKLVLVYKGKTPIDQIRYTIVHSLFDTLNSVSPDRIRKCEHENCILHFVDVSKSGRRRWCSMELCGNRHKAAQFYEKKSKKSLIQEGH